MVTRKPKFVVLRGGAIGDFIVTLPALRLVRERWPDAHLELVGYPHVARLALTAGLVDEIQSLDTAHIARFFSLRPSFPDDQRAYIESFDIVFLFLHDPDGTVRENLRLAGARQVVYASPIVQDLHAADHFTKSLESLALYGTGAAPELPWPQDCLSQGRAALAAMGVEGRALAIHPGSGSAKKNWPVARYAELALRARASGFAPFFILGEVEQESRMEAALDAAAPGVPRVARAELSDVASLLAASERYVGNDSGVTHLAAALGLPVVALFGPSDQALWAPRGKRVRVLAAPARDLGGIAVDSVWEALVHV
ncbi:MAG TPA: glycosyltransferase family 9 protein [Kiritimatiellia bacterium]